MKKFGYIVAAIIALGLVAPSIASAETVVVNHRDHGWHHHHADRVVIVKHRHHDY